MTDTVMPASVEERAPQADPEAPFAAFDLSNETVATATEIRAVGVWILNLSAQNAIIRAEAGAGSVLVDTLASGDSVQVRLLSRADSVTLRARGMYGVELGEVRVSTRTTGARAVFP